MYSEPFLFIVVEINESDQSEKLEILYYSDRET
jgi:hypothetical protein